MQKPRGILIAGNWKMNLGPKETALFFASLSSQVSTEALASLKGNSLSAWIIPPFLSLERALSESLKLPIPLKVAAQNAHWEKKGAFTGEVSGPHLQEIGVNSVLVGHSERRQYFGETNTTVRQRCESLLNQGFQVILCVGETRSERESGKTADVLTQQLSEVFTVKESGVSRFLQGQLVIAYEPVWAIGTGLTATPEQAEDAHLLIRNFIREKISADAASKTPILYGGSVTPENSDSLLSRPNVDGALVGGASLKADSFAALLNSGSRILKGI